MRIAVTYENGNIFQHFGHTETFKVYEVENGEIKSSQVIGSNGVGHGALAGLLSGEGIDVLICGGIGGGAQTALAEAGVELCSGAQGDADAAVEAYLKGELVSAGATCHHHDGGHPCSDHGDEGHCGHHGHGDYEDGHCEHHGGDHEGGCGHHNNESGHCGHGCHGEERYMSEMNSGNHGKNYGKTCRVHYKGTFNDGTQFDSSYDRGEPLEFLCGAGMMIPGFDEAVEQMDVGQIIDVHLMPEQAYGPKDPKAILVAEISNLPGSEDLNVGEQVYLGTPDGQSVPVRVIAKDDTNITLDLNHEMAGKELNFQIELVEVKEQSWGQ